MRMMRLLKLGKNNINAEWHVVRVNRAVTNRTMKAETKLTDYLTKEGFLNTDDAKLFLARREALHQLAWDIFTEGYEMAATVALGAISSRRSIFNDVKENQ
jgi:hypothetical protein